MVGGRKIEIKRGEVGEERSESYHLGVTSLEGGVTYHGHGR